MSGEPTPKPSQRSSLLDGILRVQELADYIVPMSIRVISDLRIADLLAAGPRPVEELAATTGTHAPTLRRVLRALACKGIFAEVEPGSFGLTSLAQLLRSDHPLSLAAAYPLLPADVRAWARFEHTVRTGRPAFEHLFGQRYYEYLAAHPEESARFDESVECQSRLVLRLLLPAYEWDSLGTVVDVGGGSGAFLAHLLARHRRLHAVLFDLPHVVARAPAVMARAGVADRCEIVAGSFFDAVPPSADTYLLKTILHDWRDEEATCLLRTVRRAMRPDSRLVVLEALLSPGDAPEIGRLLDLHSLVLVGGPDRDADQLARLLAGVGLELVRVVPTSTLSILEAVPV
jgi:SAM-dependent methyltransferase